MPNSSICMQTALRVHKYYIHFFRASFDTTHFPCLKQSSHAFESDRHKRDPAACPSALFGLRKWLRLKPDAAVPFITSLSWRNLPSYSEPWKLYASQFTLVSILENNMHINNAPSSKYFLLVTFMCLNLDPAGLIVILSTALFSWRLLERVSSQSCVCL